MDTTIRIQDTFTISEGVAIVLSKTVAVSKEQIADALRKMVQHAYQAEDAGCDYFYDEAESLVFIGGERDWVASRDPLHVQLLKTADMLDGHDFSAK